MVVVCLLFVVRLLLFVVSCYVLCVVRRWSLVVGYFMLCVVCCVLYFDVLIVVCCLLLWFVGCCVLFDVCRSLLLVSWLLCVDCVSFVV